MTDYLIKSILCSGILIAVYHLFLEKEKMHLFNRAYLLLALLFALIVPLISIEIEPETAIGPITNAVPDVISRISSIENTGPATSIAQPASFDLLSYFPLVCCLAALLLLIRYALNVLAIFSLKAKCKIVEVPGAKLVLVPQDIVTYTFLNNIFIPEKSYQNEQLRSEILTHELAHARQLHSLDILLIELLHALMWFNPFLFFYKKAIRLNHEFLADEAVLKEFSDVKSYQLLLLDTILQKQHAGLTSSFNYSITKKRLAMMTKIINLNRQYAKQFATALLAFVLTFTFSDKMYAQVKTGGKLVAEALPEVVTIKFDQAPGKPKASTEFRHSRLIGKPGPGISQPEVAEFFGTIEKHTTYVTNKNGRIDPMVRMEPKLEDRMHALFTKMDRDQLEMAADSGITVFQMPIPVKKAPDEVMFENWKKPDVFGIWINGKHVPNTELDKYKPTDIAEYDLSKLYGGALKGRSYKYQLDLTTNDYFDKTYQKKINDRVFISRIGWRGERPKKF
jgi:beta-lactamase regulating signal transducer with metallopeptidase domain